MLIFEDSMMSELTLGWQDVKGCPLWREFHKKLNENKFKSKQCWLFEENFYSLK